MTETGIFGGSFNPIHLGHTGLANALCQKGYVEEVWLLISPQNPLKTNCELLDEKKRLQLAQLATTEYPCIKTSDFEFSLPRPSYMFHTLEALRTAYPERQFSLIIGTDNWLCFRQWKHPEKILANHRVILFPRKGYEIDPQTLPSNVIMADLPIYPVSSTLVRERLKKGEATDDLLHAKVRKLIENEHLYL